MPGYMVLLFKIGSIAALTGIGQWIAVYSRLEPWWARKNVIGHSLVRFAVYGMVTPALFIINLFFHTSRNTSQVLAWIEIVLLLVIIPLDMARRSQVWIRVSRRGARGTLPAGRQDNSGRGQ